MNEISVDRRSLSAIPAALLLFVISVALADDLVPIESILETPGYRVTIVTRCNESALLCDNVTYTGVSKKTNRKITMRGSKTALWCSGGQHPCEALGYQFASGAYSYAVRLDGRLTVSNIKSGKILVEEVGEWGWAPTEIGPEWHEYRFKRPVGPQYEKQEIEMMIDEPGARAYFIKAAESALELPMKLVLRGGRSVNVSANAVMVDGRLIPLYAWTHQCFSDDFCRVRFGRRFSGSDEMVGVRLKASETVKVERINWLDYTESSCRKNC